MENKERKSKETVKKIVKLGLTAVIFASAARGLYYMETRPAEYHTATLTQADIEQTLSANGDVKTEESRTYYAQVSAPISQLTIRVGDEIREGDVLVTYDLDDLMLAKQRSELQVKQAASAYQSTVNQNEKNTMIYEGAVVTEEMFCQMIAEQWDVIQDLQKKLAEADDKQEEVNYYINRAASETDDDDRDDFNAMVDARHRDYQAMDRPKLAAELAKQQAIYSDMQAFRAQYATQRENADARLIDESAQQELLLKKQEASLQSKDDADTLTDGEAGVQAEFKGVVTERFVESGATVAKGEPLFTVDNLDTMYVSADVSKYDINEVAVGQRAQIRIGDETYNGKVIRIDRLASKENSDKAKIPVRIGFEGNTDGVCLGIEADVTILQKSVDGAAAIERAAVYEDEEGSYVYILRDGIVCRQNVETGLSDNVHIQILSGLEQSDRVILDAVTEEKLGSKGVSVEEE